MAIGEIAAHSLEPQDYRTLEELRALSPAQAAVTTQPLTSGQALAERVTRIVGSWPFIAVQSGLLLCWLALNVMGWVRAWDPYPFILLNLALSFQAAYTAPVILMSQNRQAAIDRRNAENDYKVNVKAELEIELLHQKIDWLREREILELTRLVGALERRLAARG